MYFLVTPLLKNVREVLAEGIIITIESEVYSVARKCTHIYRSDIIARYPKLRSVTVR